MTRVQHIIATHTFLRPHKPDAEYRYVSIECYTSDGVYAYIVYDHNDGSFEAKEMGDQCRALYRFFGSSEGQVALKNIHRESSSLAKRYVSLCTSLFVEPFRAAFQVDGETISRINEALEKRKE